MSPPFKMCASSPSPPTRRFSGYEYRKLGRVLIQTMEESVESSLLEGSSKEPLLMVEDGLLGAVARHRLDAMIMPANRTPTIAADTRAPATTVPPGFHPPNTTVVEYLRGLVVAEPRIP